MLFGFLQFYQMSFFCFTVSSRMRRDIQQLYVLLWVVTVSHVPFNFDDLDSIEYRLNIVQNAPQFRFVRCFSHDQIGALGFQEAGHIVKAHFSKHYNKGMYHPHEPSLVILSLIISERRLVRCLRCQFTLLSPHILLLGGNSLYTAHTYRVKSYIQPPQEDSIFIIIWSSTQDFCLFSFIKSILHLYQHGYLLYM